MLNKTIKSWITSGVFWLGLLVGIGVAFPFAADLLGNVIPDSAGNIWGAAIGAAIAVLGALCLENSRRGETRMRVAAWAWHFSHDVIRRLNVLNECYGKRLPMLVKTCDELSSELTPEECSAVRKAIVDFGRARLLFDKNAERLSPHLINLDITEIRSFYALEYILDDACVTAQQIDEQLKTGGARFMAQRNSLSACCRNVEIFDKKMSRHSGQTVQPVDATH